MPEARCACEAIKIFLLMARLLNVILVLRLVVHNL
jgi:hypothetical protein